MTAAATVDRLDGSPYQAYAYAYPHKTAYRHLARPVALDAVWRGEDQRALFLYIHVPFCEFRCGFCNLFTQSRPGDDLVARYLAALRREAAQVRAALHDDARFARLAIGGGTPTQLGHAGLQALLDLAADWGLDLAATPTSVEASPDTVDPELLRGLAARGVDRISLGVQSFLEPEVRAIGRPQTTAHVERALGWMRDAGFPVLNVDLIYGIPGQTASSWRESLRRALAHDPQELFLYPLYVRPLTGLARRARRAIDPEADAIRLARYREGRDLLLDQGYAQLSMRLFRKPGAGPADAPAYRCQEDAMVGLGCGARSYTRGLHYSGEYAVGQRGVREILAAYVERPAAEFAEARYGFALDADEQRRRYVIQSTLHASGLDPVPYAQRFGGDPRTDFPQLAELEARGWAGWESGILRLTAAGLERSDAIGPWLDSPRVRRLMGACDLR